MTTRELKRRLKTDGWVIIQGTGHEMALHPSRPGVKVPIPRHKGDLPPGTLKSIMKATGLE